MTRLNIGDMVRRHELMNIHGQPTQRAVPANLGRIAPRERGCIPLWCLKIESEIGH
jgi:hypothetical protein